MTLSLLHKLNINNRNIIDLTEVSKCFNNYFNEIACSVVSNLPNYSATGLKGFLINKVTSSIFLEPVSINKISNIINELNITKLQVMMTFRVFLSNFRPPWLSLYFQHW